MSSVTMSEKNETRTKYISTLKKVAKKAAKKQQKPLSECAEKVLEGVLNGEIAKEQLQTLKTEKAKGISNDILEEVFVVPLRKKHNIIASRRKKTSVKSVKDIARHITINVVILACALQESSNISKRELQEEIVVASLEKVYCSIWPFCMNS